MIQVFLQSLIETGNPILKLDDQRPEVWLSKAQQADTESLAVYLEERHKTHLLILPGSALNFHKDAAIWGAQIIFTLSAATVFRELTIPQVMGTIPLQLPNPDFPEAHFSADICLHYLPDIYGLVAQIADGDPLLDAINELAMKVPLSSVGMKLPSLPELSPVIAHPGLNQLHAERVLSRNDQSRTQALPVEDRINALVGSHRRILAPNLIDTSS